MFSNMSRDELKVPCKLMDCVNINLLNNVPNLGSRVMDMHAALHEFLFFFGLTTHD
ncbi:putative non-specific serine/threonine protein kinase [Dioscorea sansibarensis]